MELFEIFAKAAPISISKFQPADSLPHLPELFPYSILAYVYVKYIDFVKASEKLDLRSQVSRDIGEKASERLNGNEGETKVLFDRQ